MVSKESFLKHFENIFTNFTDLFLKYFYEFCFIAEAVQSCKLGHVSFTKRYEVSHCTYCLCLFRGKIICLKRHSNRKTSFLCTRCSRIPSRACSYCQIPYNRSSIVPVNHEIPMNRSKTGICLSLIHI